MEQRNIREDPNQKKDQENDDGKVVCVGECVESLERLHDCERNTTLEERRDTSPPDKAVIGEMSQVAQSQVNFDDEHTREEVGLQTGLFEKDFLSKSDPDGFTFNSSNSDGSVKYDADGATILAVLKTSASVAVSHCGGESNVPKLDRSICQQRKESAMAEARITKRKRDEDRQTVKVSDDCMEVSRDNAALRATAGVDVGDTLEVRWIVSRDVTNDDCEETEVEEVVWWRGVVEAPDVYEKDSEGRRIWQINYESQDEFPAEECKIVFLNSADVFHVDRNATLKYRRMGDNSSGAENSDDEDNPTAVLTMKDIIEAQKQIDEEEADSECDSAEAAMMSAFNSLPFLKQMSMASTYRHFADSFKEWLHTRIEEKKSKSGEIIITSEDIGHFIQCARQNASV